jgi:hypothetical protein
MTQSTIKQRVLKLYKSIEFANQISSNTIEQLRKAQQDAGYQTLAHYIDALFKDYQYAIR